MIRLIKMELYRLFHAVSTYVMIVVTAGIVVLAIFALKVDLQRIESAQKASGNRQTQREAQGSDVRPEEENFAESFANGFVDGFMSSEETSPGQEHSDVEGFQFIVTSSAEERWTDGDIDAGDLLMAQLNSTLYVVLIAIFVPLFVNAEQKKGYIKNIAGQIPRREMLAISKLPAVAVQIFVLFAALCIADLAACAIFFRGRWVLANPNVLAGALGIQYVLHVAWGCLIALFTMATRSTAFAMTSGILLASGIFELILRYLNRAVHALIPAAESFDVMRLTLNYATTRMTMQSTMRQICGFVAVAVVYILISAVVSGAVYRKRDVR